MTKVDRSSNFELLRILSMLMIIAGHFYGQTVDYHDNGDLLIVFLSSGARVAVNLFLLVGLWFMVDKQFDAKRIIKIWNTVYFWSIAFFIVAIIVGAQFPREYYLRSFFPVLFWNLWFASAYIVLLLLSPCLNLFCDIVYKKYLDGFNVVPIILVISFLIIGESTYSLYFMDTWLCAISYFCNAYILMWFYKKGVLKVSFIDNIGGGGRFFVIEPFIIFYISNNKLL